MTELFNALLRCAGLILFTLVAEVAIPAIRDWRVHKLNEAQRQQLTFWVKTAVLWAKQWMQSASGEEKKAAVTQFVSEKVAELGLPYSADDIDKSIEAIYNTVKDLADAAIGEPAVESSAVTC